MNEARNFLKKNPSSIIVFETVVNNTVFNGRSFDDFNGGATPNGLLNRDISANTNGRLIFSNGSALNSGSRDCMINGFQLRKSIGEPLTSDNVLEVGSSTFSFRNDVSSKQKIQNRKFKGASFDIKVGGIDNEGRLDENLLTYDKYLTLFSGKIQDMTHDEDEIFLALRSTPIELENQFPLNTYLGTGGLEGDDNNQGRVKPYAVGEVINATPQDLGGGLYQYHDGDDALITEVYESGSPLTAVMGDPFLDSANQGEYILDQSNPSSGYFKVNDQTNTITCDISGAQINGNRLGYSDEVVSHIINLSTKGLYSLNDLGGVFRIGYYFTEQLPVIEHVRNIITPLDYFIDHLDDGNMLLKHRSNGAYLDFSENENINDSFTFIDHENIEVSSIDMLGSSERHSTYKVGYAKNWTVLRDSEAENQLRRRLNKEFIYLEQESILPIEDGIKSSTRTIQTNLSLKSDAEKIASLVLEVQKKGESILLKLLVIDLCYQSEWWEELKAMFYKAACLKYHLSRKIPKNHTPK